MTGLDAATPRTTPATPAPRGLPHAVRKRRLSRRAALRGAGAAMALPLLDAMTPAFARAGERHGGTAAAGGGPPRRMVAVNADLGFLPDLFFPAAGQTSSPYLDLLGEHRGRATALSGVSHRHTDGGHDADLCFLTAAPQPKRPGFRNTVSLDQHAAAALGPVTRFPALALRVGPGEKTLSYRPDGTAVPAEGRASRAYEKLFAAGGPAEAAARRDRLREGQSLMDAFGDRLGALKRAVGPADRDRLDRYLTGVREVEGRLRRAEAWEDVPKPDVTEPAPADHAAPGALIDRLRATYAVARLALETDSTRLVTVFVTQQFNPTVSLPGVTVPHHALTHQSGLEDSRRQLRTVEEAELRCLAEFLSGLAAAPEGGRDLLDSTAVLHGSNLGHAGRHDTRNLPVLLAGGRFDHAAAGGLLTFDEHDNHPLAAAFVSVLHHLGVPADGFADAAGPLPGLAAAGP